MKSQFKVLSAIIATGLTLVACTNNSAPKASAPAASAPAASATASAAPSASPSAAPAASHQNENYPTWGYDYQSTRHVPYKQITQDNVKDLGVVWTADFKQIDSNIPNGNQSFPVVVDGVLYVSTSQSHVFAFDAVTGKQLWHWQPDADVIDHIKKMNMASSNRGVAVGEGKVFVLIADNRLASIDLKTGKTVKVVNLADTLNPDITAENGYYETTAPIYYKGNVYIGSSGGDNGVRCFVAAFKGSDLTPAWDQPFWTVPPKGQDWLANNSKYAGGGAVWDPISFDPETDIMYFGTGNPAPDFNGKDRPGANPHTDSVVALDSKTGKMIWATQEITHDQWDYDAAATPMVLKTQVNGKEQKVVVQGGKSSQWYAFDAATGAVIHNGIQFGKVQHPDPTPEGVLVYPGTLGGENYAPETFDPASNYVLIPGIESPYVVSSPKDLNDQEQKYKESFFGARSMGTTFAPQADGIKPYGTVTAIDVNTGKVVYQNKTDDPMRGGFTSTDAGLAFYGEISGKINAIDIKTGTNLWNFQTSGNSISSAPAIFTQDGKEYIALVTGGNKPQVVVFGLGGNKTQGAAQQGTNENPHAAASTSPAASPAASPATK